MRAGVVESTIVVAKTVFHFGGTFAKLCFKSPAEMGGALEAAFEGGLAHRFILIA